MSTTPNARDIAERIIKTERELGILGAPINHEMLILARAYLELGKDYEQLYSDYTNLLNSGQAKEIANAKAEITRLLACEASLKEELEYYKEMELRYNELLERIPKLEKQLEKK